MIFLYLATSNPGFSAKCKSVLKFINHIPSPWRGAAHDENPFVPVVWLRGRPCFTAITDSGPESCWIARRSDVSELVQALADGDELQIGKFKLTFIAP